MAKKTKFYVVWEGHERGIYDSWAQCQRQVQNYPGARYKSFTSHKEAEAAFYGNSSDFIGKDSNKGKSKLSPDQLKLIGKPNYNSISVDAACSGNPGVLEYQGVDTKTGIQFFHQGPFEWGTVNLGEFLALVHGLAFLKQKKRPDIIIYTDSKTAMAWVRNKKIKTTLPRTARNKHLFELVDRAEQWLRDNTYKNPIVKWETAAWGEIPADFGRK